MWIKLISMHNKQLLVLPATLHRGECLISITASPLRGLQSIVMCMSVCLQTYLKNHVANLHYIFYAYWSWLWLGPLMGLR